MIKIKVIPYGALQDLMLQILIIGVNTGFSKTLELNGTGYRATVSGSILKLQLGYSHDIDYEFQKKLKLRCPKQNKIIITSINKELLGACCCKD